MKKILKSILPKKSETNLNARLGWLQELHQLDETNGLKLTLKQITALLNDTELSIAEKIELILRIEEAVEDAVANQQRTFAKADNLKLELASPIAETNYLFNRTLFLTHLKLIEMSFNRTPDQQPSDLIKYLLIARGLLYGAHMLLWRYFEHAPVPANIWHQASTLFQQAETHLVAQKPASPFKNERSVTVQQLFLELVMLGNINFNNLSKLQIDMVRHLLANWTALIHPSKSHVTQHTYFIDLEKDQGVTRIRNQRMPERALFWHMDPIELEIEMSLRQIHDHKMPPIADTLSSQQQASLEETLQFLKTEWSRSGYKRQRRKEARNETTRSANVSIGIQAIFEMLKQFDLTGEAIKSMVEGTFNDRRLSSGVVMRGNTNTLINGHEKWSIHDESSLGLGSILPATQASKLKPNKLLTVYTPHRDALPALGVVKNLTQLTGGKVKVGIALLTLHPIVAIIKKFDAKKDSSKALDSHALLENQEFWGVFIQKEANAENVASIIMPKIEYIPSQFYVVTLNRHREIVKFQAPIESGDDWVRLTFPEEFKTP